MARACAHGKRTRLSDQDGKRLKKAELDERELVAKAKRQREDATAKRAVLRSLLLGQPRGPTA